MSIQIISYTCLLKNRLGHTISSTVARDVLLDPEDPNKPLYALSQKLRGIKKGEVRRIILQAQEAYGLYDPQLVTTRYLDEIGLELPFKMNEKVLIVKEGVARPMRVIQLTDDKVTFDGNHPLAGQDLVFEIKALEAREATIDEIRAATSDPIHH